MKESLKLILILTLICVIAGSLLAVVYEATRERIAAAERQEKLDALDAVLPEYDNQPDLDAWPGAETKTNYLFYVARKADQVVGVAFEVSTLEGYGDEIKIMVGIDPGTKRVLGIDIVKQKETPGLGAKIDKDRFKKNFPEQDAIHTDWCAVTKDGGEVEAVTSATISSRAVCKAVAYGLSVFKMHEKDILARRDIPQPEVQP
jgi:electron transport complex protein RnfG